MSTGSWRSALEAVSGLDDREDDILMRARSVKDEHGVNFYLIFANMGAGSRLI